MRHLGLDSYNDIIKHPVLDYFVRANLEAHNFNEIKPDSWGKFNNDWYFYAQECYTLEKRIFSGNRTFFNKKVFSRKVIFSDGNKIIEIPIKEWRGYWFINAASKAGLLKKQNESNRTAQINKYASLKKVKTINGINVYKLFIGNLFWQYAVEKVIKNDEGKIKTFCYHDKSIKKAVLGLRNKIGKSTTVLINKKYKI